MENIQRFNFDKLEDFYQKALPEDFEPLDDDLEDDDLEIEEEAPPPPSFTLQELETAKSVSFEEGRTAGIQDGLAKAENADKKRIQTIESMCDYITAEISTLRARHMQYLALQSAELSQLVMIIAQKLVGDVIHSVPTSSVEAMVDECIGVLARQPKVTLVIHPDLGNFMGDFLYKRLVASGVEGDLVIASDDTMEVNEARLEWKDGAIERNMMDVWKQIEQKLQAVDFGAALKTVEETEAAIAPPVEAAPEAPTEEEAEATESETAIAADATETEAEAPAEETTEASDVEAAEPPADTETEIAAEADNETPEEAAPESDQGEAEVAPEEAQATSEDESEDQSSAPIKTRTRVQTSDEGE